MPRYRSHDELVKGERATAANRSALWAIVAIFLCGFCFGLAPAVGLELGFLLANDLVVLAGLAALILSSFYGVKAGARPWAVPALWGVALASAVWALWPVIA